MKYDEINTLVNGAIRRDAEGKMTGVDVSAISNAFNGHVTSVVKGKEDGFATKLEDAGTNAVNTFLTNNGYESQDKFKESLTSHKDLQTNYDNLTSEVKEGKLTTAMDGIMTDLKIDEKFQSNVRKHTSRNDIYGDDGVINKDALKASMETYAKEAGMLSTEPVKVGGQPQPGAQPIQTNTNLKAKYPWLKN